MENITSRAGLINSIHLVEAERTIKGQLFKEQLFITYESLKPVNLLKYTLKEISSSPYMIDDLSGTALGLASGFLSKKIIIGTSGNIIRKLIGSILQFGVTNVVAHNSHLLKSVAQTLFQHIIRRTEVSSKSDVS